MAFGNLVVKLSGDITDFTKKLDQAKKKMNTFAADAGSKVASSSTGISKFAENLNRNYGKANAALHTHNLGLKDTARIVQGILVSQAFYQMAGSIREATSALIEFNENLDYAQVTYSALFGSTELASDFLKVLQEHSVNTIFDFGTLEQASKKLLAYGIEYKNLMFIMNGLTNLGAMSGDTASLDRIAYALGQIYAKGKLSAEEMRQLSNAYVPIKQILKDKFGLTNDQLGDVGSLNIPAEDAINAIVDYANERFGSVGDAAMLTITGLKNRIVDSLKVLGNELTTPLTTAFKSFLAFVDSKLSAIRNAYAKGGLGGILDMLVPDETKQAIIRQFLANLQNAFVALVKFGIAAGQVLAQVGSTAVIIFNIVGPFITAITNALATLLNAITSTSIGVAFLRTALITAAIAMALLRIQTIGAMVVTALSKAVIGLGKALLVLATIITKHPIIAFIVLLAGAFAYASGLSDKLHESLSKLFGSLGGGATADDMLKDTEGDLQDMESTAEQFNERMEQSGDAVDDLNKKLDKTKNKAAKALLSFDEVFKLSGSSGSGDLADDLTADIMPNLDLSGLDLSGLEVPDFSDFADQFSFKLSDELKKKVAGAGIGALLGGIIGAAIGGLPGAYIGAAIGGFAGWFWDEVADALGLSPEGAVAIPIATGLGAAIGALIGGPAGAFLGGSIGALVGWIIDGIAKKFQNPDGTSWMSVSTPIGIGIGAAIGAIIGGPAGAVLGGIIGGLAGTIVGWLSDKISASEAWNGTTIALGTGLGGAIGFMVGGPAGAAIGAAIGAVVGAIAGLFAKADWGAVWDAFKEGLFGDGLLGENGLLGLTKKTFGQAGEFFTNIKECIEEGDWAGIGYNVLMGIIYGIGGAALVILEPLTRVVNAIIEAFCELFGIHSPAEEMMPIGENVLLGILEGIVGAVGKIAGYIAEAGAALIAAIGNWFTGLGDKVSGWMSGAKDSVVGFVTNTKDKIVSWATNTGEKISSWASNAKENISSWASNSKEKISSWVTNTKENISSWWTNVKSKFDAFKSVSFSDWCSRTLSSLRTWANNVWDSIRDKIGKAIDKVKDFFGLQNNNTSFNTNANVNTTGHATGGIFNREHVAKFAEGNKAEAIIPLEEKSAMQPFVDAVANGLTATLAPMFAGSSGVNQLQPLYVGTLIADDNGLKELERKMEIIRLQESRR